MGSNLGLQAGGGDLEKGGSNFGSTVTEPILGRGGQGGPSGPPTTEKYRIVVLGNHFISFFTIQLQLNRPP